MIRIQLHSVDDGVVISSKIFINDDEAITHVRNMIIGTNEYVHIDEENLVHQARSIVDLCNVMSPTSDVTITWPDPNNNTMIIKMTYLGDVSVDSGVPSAWKEGDNVVDVFPANWATLIATFDEYRMKMEANHDCVDSFRIGMINSEPSMVSYNKLKSCCSQDDIIVDINGMEYSIGCNYDHR